MDSQSLIIAGSISIGIWLGIYLPISIFGISLFYKYRFVSVIAKRHVRMTLIVLIFCLCHICIDRVLWIIYICNISKSSVLNISSILTYPIILYGLLYSLLCRFWIIRYDIQFVRAQCNNKWRSVINEEYIEQNWYIIHKSKWGNSKFISTYILLPIYTVCIVSSIIIRLQIYKPNNNDPEDFFNSDYIDLWIMDMTMSIIPYFVIIYLWIKTPAFNDTFWIRDATKLIFIALAFLFITNIIFGILALYLKYQFVVLSLIDSHIISLTNFMIIIIMTFGVFYKNRDSFTPQQQLQAFLSAQHHSNQRKKDTNDDTSPSSGPPGPKLSLSPTQSRQKSNRPFSKRTRVDVKTVLKDSIAFHTFMTHLSTEFSMECLLAIVEFTEYEEYVLSNFSDYLSSKHDYKSKLIQLPPDIPKSLIVYGSTSNKTPTVKKHKSSLLPWMNKGTASKPKLKHKVSQSLASESEKNGHNTGSVAMGGILPTKSNSPDLSQAPSGSAVPMTPSTGAAQETEPSEKMPPTGELTLTTGVSQSNSVPPVVGINIDISALKAGGSNTNLNNSNGHSHVSLSEKRRIKTKGLYGDLKPFQIKAKALYDKYIAVGAEYEINISYDMRNAFNTMLNNEELWSNVFDHTNKNSKKMMAEKIIAEKLHEILTLLNTSIEEMIKLLSHSFARFKQTPVYGNLLRRMT